MQVDEKEFVARTVMKINSEMPGAYVFSSGKNMGTFKAVGYPEDVGVFYKLKEYEGYSWTAHGRYPTNTPGWWGGAHPFTLLNYSIVHNGEISSYAPTETDAGGSGIGHRCPILEYDSGKGRIGTAAAFLSANRVSQSVDHRSLLHCPWL